MSKPAGPVLTFMNANLSNGGKFEPDGTRDAGHLTEIAALVRDIKPHVLTTQGGRDWGKNRTLVAQAERAFGRQYRAEVAPNDADVHTATFFDQRVLEWTGSDTLHSWRTFHGFGVTELEYIEQPGLRLKVISAHLDPTWAATGAAEAALMAWRLRRDDDDCVGVIAGRFNYVPGGDPDTDWYGDGVKTHNRMSRAVETPDGLEANTVLSSALRRGGFIDVAAQAAAREGNQSLLADTGRAGARVDQFQATRALAQAVTGYERIPVHGSHKKVIVMTVDVSLLGEPPR